MRSIYVLSAGVVLLSTLVGCAPNFGPQAKYGITFYCPGAGNFDFGDEGIRQGLSAAGYRGQVASVMWTLTFNPALDQRLGNARLGAARLARLIERYIDEYPGRPVNIVGLSAGTGVAIWALEDLKRGYQVDNVVLLGSSLWYRYDVRKAMQRVKGKIYNYYSDRDPVLAGPMKIFGTIDGVFGDDGAGAVGLRTPGVVNIRWEERFSRYGYYGGHTDATSTRFVQTFLARHLMGDSALPAAPDETNAIVTG